MYEFIEVVDATQSPSGAWFGRVSVKHGTETETVPFKFMDEPSLAEVELFGRAYVASMNMLIAQV